MVPRILAALMVLAASVAAQAQGERTMPAIASLGSGFESQWIEVNGTKLHVVRGGSGPALVLLHGFPEDWFEYRKVMPSLARHFTVVAVDLRGVGESAPAAAGYDASNLAEDIHRLCEALHLERPYVFGHDIGGIVTYALVRRYPRTLRGAMIMDVAFPGLDPWPDLVGEPPFWHIRFHQTQLPEKLVSGRQAEYFGYFLSGPQFGHDELAHYAHAYRDPDHLQAAFETYRSFDANAKFFAAQNQTVDLPIVLGSGERDAFAKFVPRIAAALRAHGCTNVTTEMVTGAAHYILEEQPDQVATLIEKHAQ